MRIFCQSVYCLRHYLEIFADKNNSFFSNLKHSLLFSGMYTFHDTTLKFTDNPCFNKTLFWKSCSSFRYNKDGLPKTSSSVKYEQQNGVSADRPYYEI